MAALLLAGVFPVAYALPEGTGTLACNGDIFALFENVTLSWQPAEGALSYDLHLFDGKIMVRMLTGVTDLSATFDDLPAGNYTAELYHNTSEGTESGGSASFSVGDVAPSGGCKSLQIRDGDFIIRAVDGSVLTQDVDGAPVLSEYSQGESRSLRLTGKRNYRHEISGSDFKRLTASGTDNGAGFVFEENSAENLNEFFIMLQPDGTFIIELAEKRGCCLTVSSGKLTLEPFSGSASQKFTFCDAQGAAQDVSLRAPGSIEVYSLPKKTEYIAGQAFIPDGLSINLIYNTGVKQRIKSGFDATADTSSAGKKSATVTYLGLKTEFEIKVIPVRVESIEMKTLPTKLVYKQGEAFEPQGTSVTVTYNNGEKSVQTRGLEFYGYSKTPGVKTITVVYDGAQTQFKVSVSASEVARLVVVHEPLKKLYYVGDEIDFTGLSIVAEYTDGSTERITDYISGFSALNEPGKKIVMISFAGQSTSFDIEVLEREVISIRVVTLPDRQIYLEGDSFDPSGISVEATFADGSVAAVKGFELYGYSKSVTGTQKIYVEYKDASTSFTVYVNQAQATRISVTAKPSKAEYFWGEEFDSKGMTVHAWFNNGTDRDVTDYAVQTLEDRENEKLGVVVTYQGQVDFFELGLFEPRITLESIEITKLPDVTAYFVGDSVSFDGLEVTAFYSDGTSAVIDNYEISGGSTASHGSIAVTVTFEGVQRQFNITVGVLGDLNNNGIVEAADARLALRIATKLESATPYQLLVGDVDGISGISAADARMILRAATKLETL